MSETSPTPPPPTPGATGPGSPADGPDAADARMRAAFERLDRGVQKQLYRMGWRSLRRIQVEAIHTIADDTRHLLITAGTAGGKTEAAFLPVLSQIAAHPTGSVRAIYVGPLKALINDQFERVRTLCEYLEVPVHSWHGDIGADRKSKLIKDPGGVLLITPESIESLFVNRSQQLLGLFRRLDFLVIDELHAFLGIERGLHLQSLIARLAEIRRGADAPPAIDPGDRWQAAVRSLNAERKVDTAGAVPTDAAPPPPTSIPDGTGTASPAATLPFRIIGLSATIGAPEAARAWIDPDDPNRVHHIDDPGSGTEVRLRIHGYEPDMTVIAGDSSIEDVAADRDSRSEDRFESGSDASRDRWAEAELACDRAVAVDLVEHFDRKSGLIFANRRQDVELFADLANEICESANLPGRFLVHHGSLARHMREDTEAEMKDDDGGPRVAVCSSTLEMGIDIGSVTLVGQLGAPWSVASLKQRIGRSGRKGNRPQQLRIYIRGEMINPDTDADEPANAAPDAGPEPDAGESGATGRSNRGVGGAARRNRRSDDLLHRLQLDLLQSIAVVELMLRKWFEPAVFDTCDLSTLTQQIMSVIFERSAVRADRLHELLCRRGPFRAVEPALFARLLRSLAAVDVIEQTEQGELILGLEGERLRARKDFYAVFATPEEYRLLHKGEVLGTLPMTVTNIPKVADHLIFAGRRWQVAAIEREDLHLMPAAGRRPTTFGEGGGEVHGMIRSGMRDLLFDDRVPSFLDEGAAALLRDARIEADARELADNPVVILGAKDVLWFTWAGTREQATLAAMLRLTGLNASEAGVAIRTEGKPEELMTALSRLHAGDISPHQVAAFVEPKVRRKFDAMLDEDLLIEGLARDYVRLDAAMATIEAALAESS